MAVVVVVEVVLALAVVVGAIVEVVGGTTVEVVVAAGAAVDVEDEDEEATTVAVDVEEATLIEILVVVVWIVDHNWYRFMRLLPPQYSELFLVHGTASRWAVATVALSTVFETEILEPAAESGAFVNGHVVGDIHTLGECS
jgi:hypothetical protein